MQVSVSCSHCHMIAAPGTCPGCGHDNDRPRTECTCSRCARTGFQRLRFAPLILSLAITLTGCASARGEPLHARERVIRCVPRDTVDRGPDDDSGDMGSILHGNDVDLCPVPFRKAL
jgi:hypothetical protein